jgi:hypothetical protein
MAYTGMALVFTVFISMGATIWRVGHFSLQEAALWLFHASLLTLITYIYHTVQYTGWSKSLCAPGNYSTKLIIWRWPSQNTFGMWTVLYWTRSSRTQFGVSINVWRLVGDTLNITCNFLYCNLQVHRDFLITLYNITTIVPFSQLPGVHFVFIHTQKKKLA